MSSPWAEIVAWGLLPVVFVATCLGAGLLVARVLRITLPGPLLVPVGFCASVVAVMPGYSVGLDNRFAVAVLVTLTIAGFLAHRRDLTASVRGALWGPWSLASLAVLACYLAPAALTGSWTWTGYNFVNDTAFQFLLADWLAGHGTPFHAQPNDTALAVTQISLQSKYPLGTHGHLATLQGLLGTPVPVLYQTYIGLLMATAAAALHQLATRAGLGVRAATVAATLSPLAILTYQYGLQGNVKEMGTIVTLVAAAAVGRELIGVRDLGRWAICFGLCLAATLEVYAAAGIPFALALAGCVLVAALLAGGPELRRRIPLAAVLGVAAAVVCAIPALVTIVSSLRTLNQGFSSGGGVASALGQLVRPLPLSEAGGIWLMGDYRYPVTGRGDLLTTLGLLVVAGLVAFGTWTLIRRREPGPLTLLGALALTYVIVSPRTTPYADGKILAILSPAVVFVAVAGGASLRGRARHVGTAAVAVAGTLIVASAALAYHSTRIAPTARMEDLADVGDRFAGRGPMLFNEFEEFAKYFTRHARVNASTDTVTPRQIELRAGDGFNFTTYDLDEQRLDFVEAFPYVIVRRGPGTSQPPANFRLVYQNASYAVWRRFPGTKVLEHLPAGSINVRATIPDCSAIRALARAARPGEALVAASAPPSATFNAPIALMRPAWPPDGERPGLLFMSTPGRITGRITAPTAGRYVVWVQGSFGRPLEVRVDGHRVGQVQGTNTPRGWLAAGSIRLGSGGHNVQLVRSGGGLAPGDGARSSVGPVALMQPGEDKLVRVAPRDARRLCGHPWDWVERVSGGPPAS